MLKSITWILGLVLLAIGLLGFVSNPVFGLFEVDTTQNIVHILSGVVGIVAAVSGASYARLYLIIFGLFYGVIAVVGFANGGDVLGLFTTNRSDDYLHTAIALGSLAVGFGKKK